MHTGRSDPDLSNPAWHWAPGPRTGFVDIVDNVDIVDMCRFLPQGLGLQRSFFSNGRQLTNGSPVYPCRPMRDEYSYSSDQSVLTLGQEQTALWLVASQVAPCPHTLGLGS